MRSDDGFEDREGHQAPFTLRLEKQNAERPTSNAQRRITEKEKRAVLFNFFDSLDDGVEIRPVAGVEFGVEELAIGADFEGTAARRNQGERLDTLAELENFRRQTDGLRRVVSDDAVFDRYLGLQIQAPFHNQTIDRAKPGQAARPTTSSHPERSEGPRR